MMESGGDGTYQLIYRSRNVLTGSEASIENEVAAISQKSAVNNSRAGVTGALMFTASTFVQVIEGKTADIENTFERICCDLRHTNVELISFSSVSARAFNGWYLRRVHAGTPLETVLDPFSFATTPEGRTTPTSIVQAVAQMAVLAVATVSEPAEHFARHRGGLNNREP